MALVYIENSRKVLFSITRAWHALNYQLIQVPWLWPIWLERSVCFIYFILFLDIKYGRDKKWRKKWEKNNKGINYKFHNFFYRGIRNSILKFRKKLFLTYFLNTIPLITLMSFMVCQWPTINLLDKKEEENKRKKKYGIPI